MNKNELILILLKKEYVKRANVLHNTILHIEKLYNEHIISLNENSRYMKSINDIIKMLHTLYNNTINLLKLTDEKIEDDNIDDNTNNNLLLNVNIFSKILESLQFNTKMQNDDFIINYVMNMINIEDFANNNNSIFNFMEIDNMIKDLICNIGTSSVTDILFFYTKIPCDILFSDEINKNLIDLLLNTFNPLYVLTNENLILKNNSISVNNETKISTKYEILLGNFYKVLINVSHCKIPFCIEVYGFFNYDCVNARLRTSQICNKLLNKKKKDFMNSPIEKKKSIPLNFKMLHIKNLPIGELLSNDDKSYNNLLSNDYGLFQKYTNASFKQLFEEFIQSSLENKFKMIKILLFSNIYVNLDNINANNMQYANNAGLLFGLVKESKIGTAIIADIIYKHLNLQSRLKLTKTGSSIKYEIEKLNNLDVDDIDLKRQLMMNPNIPDKIKKLVLMKITEMKSGNSEYYKQLTFVKTLIDFPWIGKNNNDIFTMYSHDMDKKKELIYNIREKLDNKVYGHSDCKETIIELIGKWFSNPKGAGKSIGLLGPPGVGKTLIAKILGEAINIPFAQIPLGGMDDGSVLSGHSITYSGAVPGLIVKKMVEAGKSRCIIFFDELDKTAYHHGINDVFNTLIHVTDTTSNSEFTDKFFQEVKFPINEVLFIFAFNDKDKIDPILLNRMEIINVSSYTSEDKVNIINDFVIRDLKEDFGFNDYNIQIEKENALYLIDSYTMEAGVRNIKRRMEKIFSKLNIDRILSQDLFENNNIKNIVITKELIDKYIKKPSLNVKKINNVSKIGNVNGLYATSMGSGGIIPILIYKNYNSKKFKLKLTGKQGFTMKESVHFAFTVATNLALKKYRITFFKKYSEGLHIHTSDAATPKDGPSAGSAFTLAFLSIILDKPIKNNIGLTGEIDQDGFISAIGGLEYKLPGAKKAGINLTFVPKENEKDIEKLKETNKTLFDNNFKCILVDHISEILDYALLETNMYTNEQVYEKTFCSENYIKKEICSSPLSHKNNKEIRSSTETLDTKDTSITSQSKSENTKSENTESENKQSSDSESYDR
ncbi:putative Lon protease [Bodo saltans virus]|uniref:Lon protease n=1 Tax=Bodo saltans virus TaxID=2024608 RepID=A0A2H4UU76_9VIRU|nr:putative Lon protease [Bodo saltans virus]ATZ80407.1 putative Lon protease [Bodo saltans virus]